MKRRRRAALERLAVAGLATSAAAATTIGHRTARLAAVRSAAGLADPEFTRMATEKAAAAAASSAALGAAAPAFALDLVAWAWRSAGHAQAALLAAAFARSPAELARIQRRWAERVAADTLQLTQSAAGVAGAGLAPIRRTAAANASRLGRRR